MNRKQFDVQNFVSNEDTPVETRDGRTVEIVRIRKNEDHPVIGRIEGHKYNDSWSVNGVFLYGEIETSLDLFFFNKTMEAKFKVIPFDLAKAKTKDNPDGLKVVTREGKEVEIIAVDDRWSRPIFTLIVPDDIVETYKKTGKYTTLDEHEYDLLLKQPITKRRMTNRELAWWLRDCSEEHRECSYTSEGVYSTYAYNNSQADEEVKSGIRIRSNGGEWREPLIEIEEENNE